MTAPAYAQVRVGEAAVVKNEVLRVAGPSTTRSMSAMDWSADETVRTGIDSATRLVMADSTNLSLGPNATLKLDRTVFDDEHHYREVAVRMTSGAFRFVTGHSNKAAYKITTPLATIGVRGTTLDILSQRGQTIVNLQDGAASVCTTSFECIQLTRPGDTAIITAGGGGRSTIKKTNNPPWTFAATCSAAAGLCSKTQYADATPASSMTAAIPPACCAGADHGKFRPQRPVSAALLSRCSRCNRRPVRHSRHRRRRHRRRMRRNATADANAEPIPQPTPRPRRLRRPTPTGTPRASPPSTATVTGPVRVPARSTTWPDSASTR
jgi:hypothetical protein